MKKELKEAILRDILAKKPHLKHNKAALRREFNKRLKEFEKALVFETSRAKAAAFASRFKREFSKLYAPYADLFAKLRAAQRGEIFKILEAADIKKEVVFENEKSALKVSLAEDSMKLAQSEAARLAVVSSGFDVEVSARKVDEFARRAVGKIKTQTPDVVAFLRKAAEESFIKLERPEDFAKRIKEAEGFIEKRKNHMQFIARETFRQVNNDVNNELALGCGLTKYYLIHHPNLSKKPENIREEHEAWAHERRIFTLGVDPDPKEAINCHCSKKFIVDLE